MFMFSWSAAMYWAVALGLEDQHLVKVGLALEVLLDEALDARHRSIGEPPAGHEQRQREGAGQLAARFRSGGPARQQAARRLVAVDPSSYKIVLAVVAHVEPQAGNDLRRVDKTRMGWLCPRRRGQNKSDGEYCDRLQRVAV